MTLYCIWDAKAIPEDRIKKRQNTCCKECKLALKQFYRKQAEERVCRHCGNRTMTPEMKKKFKQWLREQPDYVPVKRGRPAKEEHGKAVHAGK